MRLSPRDTARVFHQALSESLLGAGAGQDGGGERRGLYLVS